MAVDADGTAPPELEVAIVGGGPGGLVSARTLLKHGVRNIAVFEETDSVGGLWNCAGREQRPSDDGDSHGNVLTSTQPIYHECLRTNMWKDMCSFSELPYPASVEIFPDAKTVRDYYQRYCETFDLNSCVRLNHRVVRCFKEKGGADDPRWIIEALDTSSHQTNDGETETKKIKTWRSKRLLICNGHFQRAFIPNDIPGLENFHGRLMHSSAFRSPKDFEGKTVLIVGGRISACDICEHLATSGRCKRIILSTRKWGGAQDFLLRRVTRDGRRLVVRPGIDRVTPEGRVTFRPIPKKRGYTPTAPSSDEERPDVVLFATGYRYRFPFLQGGDDHLSGPDGYQLGDLFKRMVSLRDPTSLAFVGITNGNFSPSIVMEYQAQWYTRCVVLEPPSRLLERIRRERTPEKDPTQHVLQLKFSGYCNSLASDIGERGFWTQVLCTRLPLHVKSLLATGYRPLLLLKHCALAVGVGLISAVIFYTNT